jgi:hypothetical protein
MNLRIISEGHIKNTPSDKSYQKTVVAVAELWYHCKWAIIQSKMLATVACVPR